MATMPSTPARSTPFAERTTGPTPMKARMARMPPRMPAEKLFTSISKPFGMESSMAWSNFLMQKPPKGPMIMAPRNIGMSAPAMMPLVAIAPTTPPRCL